MWRSRRKSENKSPESIWTVTWPVEALELTSMLRMWQSLQNTLKPQLETLLPPFLCMGILPLGSSSEHFLFFFLFHPAMVLCKSKRESTRDKTLIKGHQGNFYFDPATVLRHPATVLHNPATVLLRIVLQGCDLR
jgi:hypothetical protein